MMKCDSCDSETRVLETRTRDEHWIERRHRCPNKHEFWTVQVRKTVFDGQRYRAHRLAWLICYGHWPDGPLDHANGVPADNRIANLRFASPSQNSANTRVRCNSQTGVKNVVKHNNRFEARIRSNGKVHYLGLYKTLDEAAAVVRAKHAELFGEYTPDRERAGW
jgi:hypothetical protein